MTHRRVRNRGGVIPAAMIHDVTLAELSDRFVIIVRSDQLL